MITQTIIRLQSGTGAAETVSVYNLEAGPWLGVEGGREESVSRILRCREELRNAQKITKIGFAFFKNRVNNLRADSKEIVAEKKGAWSPQRWKVRNSLNMEHGEINGII